MVSHRDHRGHREKKKPQRRFISISLFPSFLSFSVPSVISVANSLSNFRQGLIEIAKHIDFVFQAD